MSHPRFAAIFSLAMFCPNVACVKAPRLARSADEIDPTPSTQPIVQLAASTMPPVRIPFMPRSMLFAGSLIDLDSSTEWAQRDNLPVASAANVATPQGGALQLEIVDLALPFLDKYASVVVRLHNRSNTGIAVETIDSRMYIVQQARDAQGNWRDVEYIPHSWCGHSYFPIYLPPKHHWQFVAPRFDGPIKTWLRFKLVGGKAHQIDEVTTAALEVLRIAKGKWREISDASPSTADAAAKLRYEDAVIDAGAAVAHARVRVDFDRLDALLKTATLVEAVYSAPFIGAVHPNQFLWKQGHHPSNYMDPYNE